MRSRALVAVVLTSILTTSCSYVAVRGPQGRSETVLACTTSKAVPGADLLLSLAFLGLGVGGLANSDGFGPECVGCGYYLLAMLLPAGLYLGSALSGFSKVDDCRREHDRRDKVAEEQGAAADRAAVAKRGRFFCTVAEDRPDVGACGRTAEGCRAHQAALLDRGVLAGPCHPGDVASCLTAVRTVDSTALEQCFPTARVCQAQRSIKLESGAYTELSACATGS